MPLDSLTSSPRNNYGKSCILTSYLSIKNESQFFRGRAAVVSRILTPLLQVPNGRSDRPALLVYSSNVHRFTRRICIMHLARLSRSVPSFPFPTAGSSQNVTLGFESRMATKTNANGRTKKRAWSQGGERGRSIRRLYEVVRRIDAINLGTTHHRDSAVLGAGPATHPPFTA